MKYNFSLFYVILIYQIAHGQKGYITGGTLTTYKMYPHSVYLIIKCNGSHLCGGSIVNQNIVLTAAHCMEDCQGLKKYSAHIKYGHETIHNMKVIHMNKYIQHPEYNGRKMVNDICLVSTIKKIPLSNTVKRIILMKRPPIVKYAYVAGWGTDEHDKAQYTLKYTSAQIQDIAVCRKMVMVPKGTFCAGPVTGLGSPFKGDSGSALVVDNYIQIGLVSFRVPKYSLVAYTNISYHLYWIQKTSEKLICG